MLPLYFPTRYYPAISGGDLFIMRLSKVTGGYYKEKYVILTSNAIDFAGLRNEGVVLTQDQKYFSEVHGVKIIRLLCQKIDKNDPESQVSSKSLFDKFVSDLDLHDSLLPNSALQYFFNNGPVFEHGQHTFIDYVRQRVKAVYDVDLSSLDYVYCSFLPYSNLLYSLSLGVHLKIPRFCTPFLHPENQRYDYQAIYDVLNVFDGIHACTEFEKELMVNQGIDPNKITIIPMGVDFDKFRIDDIQLQRFLNNYNLHKPYIVFSGYKNYEKGALSLIKALRLLYEKDIEIGIVFIGPTTKAFNAEWKKLLSDYPTMPLVNITPDNLMGYFDHKKIAAFNGCLCYCMVSRSDAYGIAYLESWACKKPVIAANISAMKEVVKDGDDGFLVPFDDASAIADRIEYFLRNPDIAKKMGESGYKKIINKNSWLSVSKKIREFVEQRIGCI